MRILLVNTNQWPRMPGGAETAFENLRGALIKAGNEVHTVSVDDGTVSPDPRRHRLPHGNLYLPGQSTPHGPATRLRWHWQDARNETVAAAFAALLRSVEPEVVHTHNLMGLGTKVWDVAALADIPVVHTLHDYGLLCMKTTQFRGGKDCASQCLSCRIVSRKKQRGEENVRLVSAPSHFVLERHVASGWFEGARKRVVPNVLPIPYRTRIRQGPVRNVGFLGRLDETKGLATFVEAARIMRGSGLSFKIAGKGPAPYEQHLRMACIGAGVDFIGFVPDVHDYLETLDLLVVPSIWRDVAPMVVHEAAWTGLPVVASATGGLPELVGDPSRLFPVGDAAALCKVIASAVRDPGLLEAWSQRSIRQAEGRSPDNVATAYIECYKEVLAG